MISAILSGAFLSVSLPNFFIPFAFLIGFYLFFDNLYKYSTKKALIYSFLTGLIFSFLSFYWIIYAINYYGKINILISSILFIIFSIAYSLYSFVLFGFIQKIIFNRYGIIGIFLSPFIWVFMEIFREFFPFNGFPWNLSGYMLSYINPVAQIASITSIYGVSFLVLFFSSSFFYFIKCRTKKSLSVIVLNIFIFVIIFIYGEFRINNYQDNGKPYKIAILQGNISEELKLNPTVEINKSIIDKYINLFKQAERFNPDLVVMPESAIPIFPFVDTPLKEYFFKNIENIKIPFISGFDNLLLNEYGDIDKIYNSLILYYENKNIKGIYNKIKLVPFGEYNPFNIGFIKELFPYLQGYDFRQGDKQNIITFKDLKIASLICFEAIFPIYVSDFGDFNLIVNITNDGWFGRTSAPFQHFEMSRIRAIENGTYLVRAANTGISAIINPVGKPVAISKLYTDEIIVGNIYSKPVKTIFKSYKYQIFFGFIIIFIGFLIFLETKKRKYFNLQS
ncbi:apolipoprotein N-acyltransferase [Venenivibrio stagnispumantis]|uniref:Apolipoprotein N-acyltransferase n=1 Tax=Venenivibrio stagnispumantis TaxID=407998 RepID=A0AA45WIR9_9AQUI|nr:apolipoprotein N-acyltransferase [Venenivibrio stagnispumantis]MCW4572663.1 apolipoprotein N-acyltransferase [Venenivibrio stagnispumantis]SMP01012.1 Apolipoprotein N-acyltransferase [Venenivibrio stagnispumantis]